MSITKTDTSADLVAAERAAHRLELQAVTDYEQASGHFFFVHSAVGYVNDQSVDLYFDPPIVMRVIPWTIETFERFNLHWPTRSNLDPTWDVEPLEPNDPRLLGCTSVTVYAPCYVLEKRLTEQEVRHAHVCSWQYLQALSWYHDAILRLRHWFLSVFKLKESD